MRARRTDRRRILTAGRIPAALALAAAVAVPGAAAAQVDVSTGGRVETDLAVSDESPPEALIDGDDTTHFAQHRLEDSDWRMWLARPARLSSVTFVQGWSDWSQATTVRLEIADGTTADLTLEAGTRAPQAFALDFANPTAFVDVRVIAATSGSGGDNAWGGFAEVSFLGTPVDPPDATPPVAANVRFEREGDSVATVRWTTDEPATSQVRFSTSLTAATATTPDPALVTDHAVRIVGDAPLRGYIEIRSADAAGNRTELRDDEFATIDTAFAYGVGGWSFEIDGRWVRAPEVFAQDGIGLDFVQAWIGGDGWTDWLGPDDVRAMADAGLTPELIHYYFGDPTLDEVTAERDAFLDDIRTLAGVLADSGVGDRAIVTLEPEFNQDGVAAWDGWNDLMIEAIRILRDASGCRVGVLAGDWDIDHVLTISMGRAAAFSDFVAFQEMRASTRDTPEDVAAVPDRAVRFAHWLSRKFLRPVRLGYAMVSDYDGWKEVQRRFVADLCEREADLRASGVVAVSWMSYLDHEAGGGYFDEAEDHKGLKHADNFPKPAWYVFRECVNHGPTWQTTGQWPPGGEPWSPPEGCGCRAAGTGTGAGSRAWILAAALAALAFRRRS